ncbi:MAG: uracil phosphoribosyltransferase [Eubacteriaceae bacterium]|jgi:uracil phosphoribosyltransferase|nr:uracil phosphoribosyltransferase [Eubacteriaceae bacterium]
MLMLFDHPLIQHKLGVLRDEGTSHKLFRELVCEISTLMGYEATRDMELVDIQIKTPMEEASAKKLADSDAVLVPILRAGLGMVDGLLSILPNARVGHIGLYRDHATCEPIAYYCNIPDNIADAACFVLDPMLATGGSAIAAIEQLKSRGAKKIKYLCLIAAPEGIRALSSAHGDVYIYAAAVDRCLNESGYILPGLGDAGDRLFATI